MKKGKVLAIIFVIISTFLTATGQILWKKGVILTGNGSLLQYFNWLIILGFVAYGIGAVLVIAALRLWELSRVHPFLALGFVWITLFAPIFLSETLSVMRVSGIMVIIAGVVMAGLE